MTHRNINILTVIALVIISCVLPACSKDSYSDIPEPEPTGRPTMGITISLGATRQSTRTTRAEFSDLNGGYEQGNDLENYLDIDANNYRIYFFTTDDETVEEGETAKPSTFIDNFKLILRPTIVTTENNDGSSNYIYYQFRGEVPKNLPLKFKLVTLFNWPSYPELIPEETTLEDLYKNVASKFEALKGDLSGDDPWLSKTNGNLIPFFGVREYNLEEYTDQIEIVDGKKQISGDAYVDLSTKGHTSTPLPIIRAMAKVELLFTDESGLDITFDKVKLTNVNPEGYCAPEASDFDDYDHGYQWDQDFTQKVHLPWSDESGKKNSDRPIEGLQMTKSENGNQQKWVAYVPEFFNGSTDECRIEVTMGDRTNYIYFTLYGKEAGERYNIERNNIYRFKVTMMTTSMECQVDVQPYASVAYTADYGLMRDEAGDIKIQPGSQFWSELQRMLHEDSSLKPKVGSYDKNGDFVAGTDTIEFHEKDLVDPFGNVMEDYYAIVSVPDPSGTNQSFKTEIWIKDADGCRVISNFGENVMDDREDMQNDPGCSAREVRDFTPITPVTYYKDKEGYQRVRHNRDHSSIVLNHDKEMYFKTVIAPEEGEEHVYRTNKIYPVESWDETSREFWYLTYVEYTQEGYSGNPTVDNPDITLTYKKGDAAGEIPEKPEADKNVTVKYSELSKREKELLEQIIKEKN